MQCLIGKKRRRPQKQILFERKWQPRVDPYQVTERGKGKERERGKLNRIEGGGESC